MRYVFGAIDQVTGQINAKQATLNSKLDELRHVISPLSRTGKVPRRSPIRTSSGSGTRRRSNCNQVLESVGRAVARAMPTCRP